MSVPDRPCSECSFGTAIRSHSLCDYCFETIRRNQSNQSSQNGIQISSPLPLFGVQVMNVPVQQASVSPLPHPMHFLQYSSAPSSAFLPRTPYHTPVISTVGVASVGGIPIGFANGPPMVVQPQAYCYSGSCDSGIRYSSNSGNSGGRWSMYGPR